MEVFDGELRQIIGDLEETRSAGPAAVGIAAPQVGCFQRIVILNGMLFVDRVVRRRTDLFRRKVYQR